MSQSTNLLLLFLPEELLGPLLVLMIMIGGSLIMVGARRKGSALVITAISLPIVMALIEVLMNEVFMALPEALVMPVAIALQVLIYGIIAWSILKLVVGQKAIDEAKGHLLADAIRWLIKLAFSRRGAIVLGSLLLLSWVSIAA